MEMESLYQVLEIDPASSQEQIKAAYRTLAKKYHPDRNGGSKIAEEKFKTVSDAYTVLSDPKARAEYDRERHKKQMQTMSLEDVLNMFSGKRVEYDCPSIDELAAVLGVNK